MTKMTQEEKETFLAGLHVGVLGLNDGDRGPLVVPIWYDYTPGGEIWMITGEQSRKGKLLAPGTRVGFTAQNEAPPYTYVSVEGVIRAISPTAADTLLAMAIRYLGEKQGQAYAAASPLEGQVTVHVEPTRWLAVDYNKLTS